MVGRTSLSALPKAYNLSSSRREFQFYKMELKLVRALLVAVLVVTADCDCDCGPKVLKIRVTGASGTDVVQDCIRALQNAEFGNPDFLRRIAWVESRDGNHTNTYRQGYHGGIWQVDRAGFLDTKAVNSHPLLKAKHEAIMKAFDIDWSKVQWEELRKPLYSALAARLLLSNVKDPIPNDLQGQARYWKEHYNKNGKGNAKKFIQDIEALEQQN